MSPTYDYICDKCTVSTEEFRRVQDRDDLVKCHECGKPMKRTPGTPGIIFKGPGFYENDYKKKR